MRVFFSLRNPRSVSYGLLPDTDQMYSLCSLCECHQVIPDRIIIICEATAYIRGFLPAAPVKSCKLIITEGPVISSCTVRRRKLKNTNESPLIDHCHRLSAFSPSPSEAMNYLFFRHHRMPVNSSAAQFPSHLASRQRAVCELYLDPAAIVTGPSRVIPSRIRLLIFPDPRFLFIILAAVLNISFSSG